MRKAKIILAIILIIVIVLGVLAFWQRNNLRTLKYLADIAKNPGENAARTEELKNNLDAALRDSEIIIPEINPEDLQAIGSGEMSLEDAAQALIDRQNAQHSGMTPGGTDSPDATPSAPPTDYTGDSPDVTPPAPPTDGTEPVNDAQDELKQQIELKITSLYLLEASFTGQIEELVQSTKDEYHALPKEKQTSTAKYNLVMSKAGELLRMEEQCDSSVKTLTDELRELLAGAGQDTSLADDVYEYYEQKKADKKAQYVAQFKR